MLILVLASCFQTGNLMSFAWNSCNFARTKTSSLTLCLQSLRPVCAPPASPQPTCFTLLPDQFVCIRPHLFCRLCETQMRCCLAQHLHPIRSSMPGPRCLSIAPLGRNSSGNFQRVMALLLSLIARKSEELYIFLKCRYYSRTNKHLSRYHALYRARARQRIALEQL